MWLWLSKLGAGIAGFFAALIAKKTAAGLALIATYALLTVGIIAAVMSSLTAAQQTVAGFGSLPSEVLTGFLFFMPDNLSFCVGLVIAARIQVTLYLWNVRNLRWMAQA